MFFAYNNGIAATASEIDTEMKPGGLVITRIKDLQIVNGESYLTNYTLKIEKEKEIPAARGCIYDRNGEVLAYNELAYSVKIEDVFESGKNKNAQINDIIYRLIAEK